MTKTDSPDEFEETPTVLPEDESSKRRIVPTPCSVTTFVHEAFRQDNPRTYTKEEIFKTMASNNRHNDDNDPPPPPEMPAVTVATLLVQANEIAVEIVPLTVNAVDGTQTLKVPESELQKSYGLVGSLQTFSDQTLYEHCGFHFPFSQPANTFAMQVMRNGIEYLVQRQEEKKSNDKNVTTPQRAAMWDGIREINNKLCGLSQEEEAPIGERPFKVYHEVMVGFNPHSAGHNNQDPNFPILSMLNEYATMRLGLTFFDGGEIPTIVEVFMNRLCTINADVGSNSKKSGWARCLLEIVNGYLKAIGKTPITYSSDAAIDAQLEVFRETTSKRFQQPGSKIYWMEESREDVRRELEELRRRYNNALRGATRALTEREDAESKKRASAGFGSPDGKPAAKKSLFRSKSPAAARRDSGSSG
jgi:hypothetical protein